MKKSELKSLIKSVLLEVKKLNENQISWKKWPEVTTGGKSYFWNANNEQGNRIYTVVWDRFHNKWIVQDRDHKDLGVKFDSDKLGKEYVEKLLRDKPETGNHLTSPNEKELFLLWGKLNNLKSTTLYGNLPFSDNLRNFAYIIMTKYGKTRDDAIFSIQEFWRQGREVAEKMVSDVEKYITEKGPKEGYSLGSSHGAVGSVPVPPPNNSLTDPIIT